MKLTQKEKDLVNIIRYFNEHPEEGKAHVKFTAGDLLGEGKAEITIILQKPIKITRVKVKVKTSPDDKD